MQSSTFEKMIKTSMLWALKIRILVQKRRKKTEYDFVPDSVKNKFKLK